MNLLRFQRNPIEYLYHVTYYNRLESISTRGLKHGQQRSIGNESYDFHRKRRVFLTEGPGVFFWHSRAEAFAEHNSDNIIEDGLVPVVLRVLRSAIEEDNDLELDEIGTRDAGGHESWMLVDDLILPEDLEVWSGKRWISVEDYEGAIDPEVAVNATHDDYDEYGEADVYYSFKTESPLFPPELHP